MPTLKKVNAVGGGEISGTAGGTASATGIKTVP